MVIKIIMHILASYTVVEHTIHLIKRICHGNCISSLMVSRVERIFCRYQLVFLFLISSPVFADRRYILQRSDTHRPDSWLLQGGSV